MTTTTHPTLTLGDRLRRARIDAGLGSEEMADLFAVGRTTITNWETGKAIPTPRKVRRWAEIVAERTSYEYDALLLFFGLAPSVTDIAERRRGERRVASRQSSQATMWIAHTDTVGNGNLRILPAA